MEDVRKQEKEEGTFKRGELPEQFTARKLFGWSDKRYNEEYWAKLERNWRQWRQKTVDLTNYHKWPLTDL